VIDFDALDRVVKEMMASIESSKDQMYDIAENARQECSRVKVEVDSVRQETLKTISEVDDCIRIDKVARVRLMEVSRDFQKYSEEDIKKAYDYANSIQVRLSTLREKEHHLKKRRDDLERSLRKLGEIVDKAENLCSQVGVVLQFIGGNLEDISVKIDDLQKRQQLGVRIIKAQEEERKRVARDIHDGPAQSLANLVLRLEICERLLNVDTGRAKGELQELKGLVRGNLQEIRRIIFDLRPMTLDDLGLVPTLRRLLGDFGDKHKIAISLELTGEEKRFRPAVEITIFRLIQEALQNVRKHSMATQVLIRIEPSADKVRTTVKDNGRGFSVEQISVSNHPNSYGLVSMRERAELVNGTVEVKSSPGQGTEVVITIPLKS